MTTQLTNQKFALAAGDGRTAEPLEILGEAVLVKLASSDTGGAAAIFHLTVPPMSGPPMHRHSREDEWFYVLEGTIVAEIDGERITLQDGSSGFAARGTVHAFQNFTTSTAKLLVMTTPGANLNRFFEAVSAHNKGLPAPDFVRTEQIMNEHGIEMIGPPLA
jgi:quercetin dioxygenase-like cupin family protein